MLNPTYRITVSGLSKETISNLRAKAELAGKSLEEVAAAILAVHGKLSMQERLATADRVQARGPRIGDMDVPAMIREDRER
jgi:hypothetical protein